MIIRNEAYFKQACDYNSVIHPASRQTTMDGYQKLANAVVKQAAIDYFDICAGFDKRHSKESLEDFFHSEWFSILTDMDPEYLIAKIKERADSMVLIYTVAKERGSSRYYVCKVGEKTPLTRTFTTKKKALHKAAEMQDLTYTDYMRIRRRDGVDNADTSTD